MGSVKTVLAAALIAAVAVLVASPGSRAEEKKPVAKAAGETAAKRPAADEKGGARNDGEDVSKTNGVREPSGTAAPAGAGLVYKPPLRGAPAGRVGGGTRGTERESFQLMVLAPDHVGLTVMEQPTLYWYVSKVTAYPVEVTVIERHAVKPLFEKTIEAPKKEGIQAIRLVDYGVRLKRDVQYKWFVTLVAEGASRSKDILAGGIITTVSAPSGLAEKVKAAGPGQAPFVYAEAGLWYDALDAISASIDASPQDAALRGGRAALLEQVGLAEVAEFEKTRPAVGK